MALKDWIQKREQEERRWREAQEEEARKKQSGYIDPIVLSEAKTKYDEICEMISYKLKNENRVEGIVSMPLFAYNDIGGKKYPIVKEQVLYVRHTSPDRSYVTDITYKPCEYYNQFWKALLSMAEADGVSLKPAIERENRKTRKTDHVALGDQVSVDPKSWFTPSYKAKPVILFSYARL